MLTATDPLGVVTSNLYDGLGDLTSTTRDAGRLNQVTSFTYDGLGDVETVTDPDLNVTSNAWDADRRLTSVTAPPAPRTLVAAYTYDPDARLLRTQWSAGGTVLATTASTYTLSGKVQTTTDANGNVGRLAYDTVDRLASSTDPVGNITTYAYDAMSRPTQVFNPAIQAGALLAKAYTPDGPLAGLTDANSHATTYAYDGFDRLASATYPDTSSETYSYDANGNPLTRKTRKGDTIAFAYDTLNRVCTKTIATTPTACGGTSASPLTLYAYDQAGRLTGANDNSAAIAAVATQASYANIFAYDALNRPLSATWSPAAAQTAPAPGSVAFTHGYDANNRRITQAVNDNSWLLYPATAGTTAYTANNLNQYTAVGSASPVYDGNGNPTSDGTLAYTYDAESRLTLLKQGATTLGTYAYDAQGRRKTRTVGGATTVFVTDADNREVLEYDGASGLVQHWYAYGPGPNAALNQMNVPLGTRATLIPDIQGSIIATLDSATGVLTKANYLPFGENTTSVTAGLRYTAARLDPEAATGASQPSGLYYVRARLYSPTWGRFMQPDPIGYSGGINLYAYVNNDPMNLADPNGLIGNCYAMGNCPGGNPYGSIAAAQASGQRNAKLFFTVMGAAVACIVACPEASAAALITTAAGAVGGAITGYNASGTAQGAALGATAGGTIGLGVGTLNPGIAAFAAETSGSLVLGGAAFTSVNGLAGAGVAGSAMLLNGKTPSLGDLEIGGAVGAGSGLIEAPFVAAGGGGVLGYGAAGDAALSFQSGVYGAAGSLATTCTVGGGCAPPPK